MLEPGYYRACCVACYHEQKVHSNAHWSMCGNCGIAMKIHNDGTRQDLIDVDKAIRRLMHGDFEVIE